VRPPHQDAKAIPEPMDSHERRSRNDMSNRIAA
jgi:hypothetical protein